MNCPICKKGRIRKTNDLMKQDSIGFEVFKCSSCGEEIMNMEQLRVLANEYRKLYLKI